MKVIIWAAMSLINMFQVGPDFNDQATCNTYVTIVRDDKQMKKHLCMPIVRFAYPAVAEQQ